MQHLTRRSRLDWGKTEPIELASLRGLGLIVNDKKTRKVIATTEVEY